MSRNTVHKVMAKDTTESMEEEVPNETASEEMVPDSDTEISAGGPRIAVNPAVFKDKRDALCVALNESYRVIMELNGFEPQAEPTERQREFFSDTAYGEDELQLRRTILARICTFDTSVGDPTDEQLEEAVEFLETVMEIGAPQNEWEQSIVQRTHDILKASIGMPRKEREPENPAPTDAGTGTQAAVGGGDTDEDDNGPSPEDPHANDTSLPQEDDNGPSPEDPHANNTSPQPDTNPVNDRVMYETEDINKPDDSAVTGEKQGVQVSVDRSGLKALLLHADDDNEDEEI